VNTKKIVLMGLVGIAILLAAALLAIRFLGDRAPAMRSPLAGAAEPAPSLLSRPAVPTAATAEQPSASASQNAVLAAAAPTPPGDGPPPWDAVETALRPAGLGSRLAGPVANGLAEARDRIDHCFTEEKARLENGPPEPSGAPSQEYGSAVLVLRMEAQDGKLVVADSEIARQGHATTPFIECCRRAMKAYEVAAPGVAAPQRYKVMFPLQ